MLSQRIVLLFTEERVKVLIRPSSKEVLDCLIIDEKTFFPLESAFSGFHDWLRQRSEIDGSDRIVGVALFPFDDRLSDELLQKNECRSGQGKSVEIIFRSVDGEVTSGSEQSFGYHQYFRSESGYLAVVLDMEALSESERHSLSCQE